MDSQGSTSLRSNIFYWPSGITVTRVRMLGPAGFRGDTLGSFVGVCDGVGTQLRERSHNQVSHCRAIIRLLGYNPFSKPETLLLVDSITRR